MRRLAEALDVQAGALYRYFATKQDLLTAMAEHMMDGVADAAGTGDGDWSEKLAALARAMRTALLAHRDGARVFAGTHSTGENTLGLADTIAGVMRAAGFPDDDAVRALYTVANFTVGHTLEEQAALQTDDGGPADPAVLADTVAAGTYPHLKAGLPALTSADFTRLFEFGVDLLVEGLRARRRSSESGSPFG